MSIKEINNIVVIISVFSIISAVFFGLSYVMSMEMGGVMRNCLFYNINGICPMNLFEHLNLWRNIFVANLPRVVAISLYLAILFALTFSVVLGKIPGKSSKNSAKQKLCIKQKPGILLFDYLREAFSKGILNPKIY